MERNTGLGRIIILNGAPRSGKSSIIKAIQSNAPEAWINLGVDNYMSCLPERLKPGIGLRPGGERPELEAAISRLYLALYDSLAAHARQGLNVIADLGHHEAYSQPLNLFARCAKRLSGLPVLVVGIRCPLEVIMERRRKAALESPGIYVDLPADGEIPAPVLLWEEQVHKPGIYDLEIDTSLASPQDAASRILSAIDLTIPQPGAIERLAQLG